jgi:hypothetical protein
MEKAWVVIAAFVCSVSATGALLAEEGDKPNRIERGAARAVQGTENTARRAAKFTEKTATRAGKFVEKTATRAGNFTAKTAKKVDKSVRNALE